MKGLIVIGTIATVVMVAGCTGKSDKAAEETAIPVKALTVSLSAGSTGKNYVGTIEENSGSMLSFEVPGNIQSVAVDAGQRVAKGQVLAVLDKTTLQQAHAAALSTLKQAEDAYRRFDPLHKQSTITDLQWVEIETKLQQAKAAEAIARKQLGNSVLHAPFSGVIATRSADPGMNVLPGQPVMKLVSIDKVNVKISVPEKEIAHIAEGQQAVFTVAALGGQSYTGRVSEKGIAANPLSHTYQVKISLANPKQQLMPGMVCSVSLESVGDSAQIVIPASAVQLDTDGSRFVWIVKGDKAQRCGVQAGQLTGEDGVVIAGGLHEGDRVITEGAQKVSNGMKVSVQ